MNAIADCGQKKSSHRWDVFGAIFKGAEHSLRLFLLIKTHFSLRHCQRKAAVRAVRAVVNCLLNCHLMSKVALANFKKLSQDGQRRISPKISAPHSIIGNCRMTPLSARSISIDSTFKDWQIFQHIISPSKPAAINRVWLFTCVCRCMIINVCKIIN
jgi:hypothetical protein